MAYQAQVRRVPLPSRQRHAIFYLANDVHFIVRALINTQRPLHPMGTQRLRYQFKSRKHFAGLHRCRASLGAGQRKS